MQLTTFLKHTFHDLNPSAQYHHNWHIDAICHKLEQVAAGNISRLIINLPPRHLKSIITSVAWPAWLLGEYPDKRVIAASYSYNLSNKFSIDCRGIMQQDWYKNEYPNTKLLNDPNRQDRYYTTEQGSRIATSVMSNIIGEGADILIVDDPHNPTDIYSSVHREAVKNWFDTAFLTRLNSKQEGAIVVVMQRLHVDDLTAHLHKKKNSPWDILSLPAISEHRQRIQVAPKQYYIRQPNEVLHPKREDRKTLESLKNEMGQVAYRAQYQQNPMKDAFTIIHREWIQYYEQLPPGCPLIFQSWDTALKESEDCDYSVCTTWAEINGYLYLLHCHRCRYSFVQLRAAFEMLVHEYHPETVLIEDQGSGISLYQEFVDSQWELGITLEAFPARQSKYLRLSQVASYFQNSKIFIPKPDSPGNEWVTPYLKELLSFPNTRHDDQIDSTSQFLNWHRKTQKSHSQPPRVRFL